MRALAASVIIFGYILFCWVCWWLHRRKLARVSIQDFRLNTSQNLTANAAQNRILIGYASQTGQSTAIAQQTAMQLQDAGIQVILLPLTAIKPNQLQNIATALFIVSTYGEGEAPDNAIGFLTKCHQQLPVNSLKYLRMGILALGDSQYRHFCSFGHQLYQTLHHLGAVPLFDLIEVDKLDASALRHWQYYLGQLSGQTHFTDWSTPNYQDGMLIQRQHINNGSPGAPAFILEISPPPNTQWQAGDLLEIGPANSEVLIQQFLQTINRQKQFINTHELRYKNIVTSGMSTAQLQAMDDQQLISALPELPHREYSIASIPQEKTLKLLVRQHKDELGMLGLGSGWLTQHAALHSPIRLRVRKNAQFHSPDECTPLILIGNGTGIAGLRSHIAAREAHNNKNWLIFGERTRQYDNFFATDIERWLHSGHLQQADVVFSRDAMENAPRYVQDVIKRQSILLREWINDGAAIYICGSLKGMAKDVDEVLTEILGVSRLEQLSRERRYCRDVY